MGFTCETGPYRSDHMSTVATLWEVQVIRKVETPQQRVFGWGLITRTSEGVVVVDKQGDMTEVEDMEEAAYDFAKSAGLGGEMHEGAATARLIESMAFTPEKLDALGIPAGVLPVAHWVGFEVPAATFKRVQAGERLMFSVEGTAEPEAVVV